jgi:hypothetical protein
MRKSRLLTSAIFLVALLEAVYAKGVYPPGPVADWFKSQRNPMGQFCCDKSDGHFFYGDYTPNPDGSIDLTDPDDGSHYHIDKDYVLIGPNPTGAAIWWYEPVKGDPIEGYDTDGRPMAKWTYCFAPGGMA